AAEEAISAHTHLSIIALQARSSMIPLGLKCNTTIVACSLGVLFTQPARKTQNTKTRYNSKSGSHESPRIGYHGNEQTSGARQTRGRDLSVADRRLRHRPVT